MGIGSWIWRAVDGGPSTVQMFYRLPAPSPAPPGRLWRLSFWSNPSFCFLCPPDSCPDPRVLTTIFQPLIPVPREKRTIKGGKRKAGVLTASEVTFHLHPRPRLHARGRLRSLPKRPIGEIGRRRREGGGGGEKGPRQRETTKVLEALSER